MFAPSTGEATSLTQREYLRWVVQLAGDCPTFDSNSTDEDYIKWAKKQKMDPKQSQKGWDMDAPLTQEVLAETLAQFFDLGKPKKGMDYVRLLLREGITVPEQDQISREDFVSLVDQIGFQGRTWWIAKCKASPNKPSKKPSKPPKPPKPPKVPTPKKVTPPKN